MVHSMFSLVICFTHSSVYVPVPVSQFISQFIRPPLSLLGNCGFVLYTCVLISALPISSHCTNFLDSTYKQYYLVFVFLFLIYFTPHDCLSVHPHLCKWNYFIPFYRYYSIVYICHISFIHVTVDGHFGVSMSWLL